MCIATQHRYHAVKALKTTQMERPSKKRLAGRSNQTKKLELRLKESLKLRLYCTVKKLPVYTARTKESDLEVSDSENESNVDLCVI